MKARLMPSAAFLIAVFIVLCGASQTPAPKPADTAPPPLAICSTDSIVQLLGISTIADSRKADLLRQRLKVCSDQLVDDKLKKQCTPKDSESDVVFLFSLLSYCVAKGPSPPSPPPIPYYAGRPTFYVLAPGASDPIVQTVVLRYVVDQLHQAVTSPNPTGQDTFDQL